MSYLNLFFAWSIVFLCISAHLYSKDNDKKYSFFWGLMMVGWTGFALSQSIAVFGPPSGIPLLMLLSNLAYIFIIFAVLNYLNPYPRTSTEEYSLKWGTKNLEPKNLIIYLSAIILGIILSWYGVLDATFLGIKGVSSLYFSIAFLMAFTLWFGGWGILAAYIAGVFGAGILSGLPLNTSLLLGLADVVEVVIPFIMYRTLARLMDINPSGKGILNNKNWVSNWAFFLSFAVVIPSIVGGFVGVMILYLTKSITVDLIAPAWFSWSVGNIVVLTVIGPLLMQFVSPWLEKYDLTTKGIWS
ncbi:MAG: MASE1 domain-containing protein [Candidatus Saganbacteria bacterium]|nr:MASE1 domain-containing protein [Candidatus Saganbacteria bacterium]